jgi:hypothetical protein
MKLGNGLKCCTLFRTPKKKRLYVQAATGGVESRIVKDNVSDIMEKGWVNVAFILTLRPKGKIKPVFN